MNKTEKILAVVVTHSRIELLRECVNALQKQTVKIDVLIVDNDSTDGTKEYLQSIKEDNVFFLNLTENIGGAGGFNLGMKYGFSHNYDYLYLLDDDAVASPDAVEKLLIAAKKYTEYAFFSSRVNYIDGSVALMNVCVLKNGKTTDKLTAANGEKVFPIKAATFVSILIKASAIKEFGYPIKDFFIWSDDIEYTTRITKKRLGLYVPESVVTHKILSNKNADLTTVSVERIDRAKIGIRNRYYIAKRDGFIKKLRFYARHFLTIIKILLFAKDNKFLRVKAIFTGIKEGKNFYPLVENRG